MNKVLVSKVLVSAVCFIGLVGLVSGTGCAPKEEAAEQTTPPPAPVATTAPPAGAAPQPADYQPSVSKPMKKAP